MNTLSATEVGIDTFAANIVHRRTGALSVTETGNDTISVSGLVRTPWIASGIPIFYTNTGPVYAINSNSVTLSAQTLPSISVNVKLTSSLINSAYGTTIQVRYGALTVTESGNDTFASTGKVLVKGTLASTEIGIDTFNSTGKVLVKGTLASTEIGIDTFNSTGKVIVKGQLSATEIGIDTFSSIGKVLVKGTLVGIEQPDIFACIIHQRTPWISSGIPIFYNNTGPVYAIGGNASTLSQTSLKQDRQIKLSGVSFAGLLGFTYDVAVQLTGSQVTSQTSLIQAGISKQANSLVTALLNGDVGRQTTIGLPPQYASLLPGDIGKNNIVGAVDGIQITLSTSHPLPSSWYYLSDRIVLRYDKENIHKIVYNNDAHHIKYDDAEYHIKYG